MSPIDEIRSLAQRALADCEQEQQAARAAMIRAEAHLDKHHELMALASRVEAVTVALGGVDYVVRPA